VSNIDKQKTYTIQLSYKIVVCCKDVVSVLRRALERVLERLGLVMQRLIYVPGTVWFQRVIAL